MLMNKNSVAAKAGGAAKPVLSCGSAALPPRTWAPAYRCERLHASRIVVCVLQNH